MHTPRGSKRVATLHTVLILGLVFGCDGESTLDAGLDSGPDASASLDAAATCARPSDCEDGVFCTEHVCMPGTASADARGCVPVDGPCLAGEACDEDAEMCVANDCSVPDADGDGDPSIACGGGDCDDNDDTRYPGNGEVCDADGHDEDCVPASLAGDDGDEDGDGFTSALCCNGPSCGEDCDDDDPAIRPGARETCDGRDDDCDGAVDEETDGPICPGGVCRAGRCDLDTWARTFAAEVADVAMDGDGNVYAVGSFFEASDFGAGVVAADRGLYVVSYAPDGRYRWDRTYPAERDIRVPRVVFDESADRIYVSAFVLDGTTPGGTTPFSGALLFALDRTGALLWHQGYSAGVTFTQLAADNGPIAAGSFAGPINLGGSDRSSSASLDAFVVRFGAAGAHQWDYVSDNELGSEIRLRGLAVLGDGSVAAAGGFTHTFFGETDFGGGGRTSDASDSFVLLLDSAGSYRWDFESGGTGPDSALDVTASVGQLYMTGSYSGEVTFGAESVSSTDERSYLLQLNATGVPSRVASFGAGPRNEIASMDLDSSGNL
ncbi:MAG: MopE-related protein [Sandaracinaceae bacterium]